MKTANFCVSFLFVLALAAFGVSPSFADPATPADFGCTGSGNSYTCPAGVSVEGFEGLGPLADVPGSGVTRFADGLLIIDGGFVFDSGLSLVTPDTNDGAFAVGDCSDGDGSGCVNGLGGGLGTVESGTILEGSAYARSFNNGQSLEFNFPLSFGWLGFGLCNSSTTSVTMQTYNGLTPVGAPQLLPSCGPVGNWPVNYVGEYSTTQFVDRVIIDNLPSPGSDFLFDLITFEPLCGTGLIEAGSGEACDDGNADSGDGCSSSCQVEANYACETDPGEASVCELDRDVRKCKFTLAGIVRSVGITSVRKATKCKNDIDNAKRPAADCMSETDVLDAVSKRARALRKQVVRTCDAFEIDALEIDNGMGGTVSTVEELISTDGTSGVLVDDGMNLGFGLFDAAQGAVLTPGQKDERKCQKKVFSATTAYGLGLVRMIRATEDKVDKGKLPPGSDPLVENAKKITNAQSRLSRQVEGKCEGFVSGLGIGGVTTMPELLSHLLGAGGALADASLQSIYP